jgi:hypothetical protein
MKEYQVRVRNENEFKTIESFYFEMGFDWESMQENMMDSFFSKGGSYLNIQDANGHHGIWWSNVGIDSSTLKLIPKSKLADKLYKTRIAENSDYILVEV